MPPILALMWKKNGTIKTASEANQVKRAWTMYDWANSAYSLVITTAIFPIFYNAVTETRDADGALISDKVQFFGLELINTQLFSYVLASSFIVVILVGPLLSGMADYAGKKLWFMKVFCYIGAAGCVSMYWFDPAYLELSMVGLFVANIGFWGSLGFYNAYLPIIAPPEEHDKLSARGFSMGYVGSVLLLLVCLALITLVGTHTTPWAFILVGVWWVSWAQPSFRKLPANPFNHRWTKSILLSGFKELRGVANELRGKTRMTRYLLSFFVISMAVQTIMLMASSFGIKEIRLETNELILAILAVQILAIPGALFVSLCSKRWGNIATLAGCLIVWIAVCLFAYQAVDGKTEFFIAAGFIGFLMGGTQSLNRSTYSKMLPDTEEHASYFSFYEVLEKGGLIVGMFSWGYIEGFTGSMRSSILAIIVFFVVGLAVLLSVPRNVESSKG
jgi:MFS transporter, UMF1 family